MRWTAFLLLFLFTQTRAVPPTPRAVTNEDIRDAILSVAHMLRSIEDKLERHEFRERALGEHVKKNFITLDKRIKLLDPIKGTISRLDERLATVETILMSKDERERMQLQKTFDTVEDIQKNLPSIMEKLKSDIIDKIPVPSNNNNNNLEQIQKTIFDRLDNVTKATAKITRNLDIIQKDNEVFKKDSEKSAEDFDRVKKQLSSNELLLQKYEHTLSEFNNKVPTEIVPIDYKEQKDWQTSFMQALDVQKNNVEKVSSEMKSLSGLISRLPEKSDLSKLENETLDALQQLKYETSKVTDKSSVILEAKLKEVIADSDKKHEEVLKSSTDLNEAIEMLTGSIGNSYQQLNNDIASLSKIEQVMMQTADGVIDTKRRVEYGVHQILLEVGNLVKEHGDKINTTINDRFDNFELSILDGETGALANLTSKISQEIDQVWRQIGIMHQQMSASTDTLDKLQNQTDAYVNGSLNVMDSMKGKVGLITTRMSEVDDNLNYLLGRLSLVVQEFNQIKSGLGKALDEIKGSFAEVENRLNPGPGPHNIPNDELEDNNNINSRP